MRRSALAALVAAALVSPQAGLAIAAVTNSLRAQDPTPPAAPQPPAPIAFDVASIKPNTSGDTSSSMRTLPNGQVVMTNASIRTIIGRAYPSRGSNEMLGVPSWAESGRYDVIAKADRPVSRGEQQEMWRALLADRMKLAAHYEPREEESYDLVFARKDHRLGPQMKPSTCTPPAPRPPGTPPPPAPAPAVPPTGADVMARCSGFLQSGNHIYAPHTTAAGIAGALRLAAGRLVVDKTGLQGFFDVEFSYSDPRLRAGGAAAEPGDPPDLFTAVQEQLGLRLVPAKTQVEVVVIDHVEPPTEN